MSSRKQPADSAKKLPVGLLKTAAGSDGNPPPTNRFQVLLLRSQTVCQIISEQLLVFVTEMKKLARL